MDRFPFRITTSVLLVLDIFMADLAHEHYGLDIGKETGLKAGSLYPILARLENAGWLSGRWEETDADDPGRPRRRYYALTQHGIAGAKLVRARTSPALSRSLRLRWQP